MSDLVNLGFRADTGGLTRAQNELDKTTVAGGRLDKQNSITTRSLGLVGTAIAAVGVTASLQQLIKYTDSWSNLNTQLRQVTSSEEQLLSVREQLLQVSRDTRIDLDATVGLYAEMTRGTSDLNISSDKLVEITKTLNNLFLAGGKPLSEMTGAIRQLNQGFASGVLRGDEFNSVAEGAPRIMDALSASLGKTRGELREFAATGGITSAVMIKALESYSGTAQQLANTVKLTFEQTMGLVKTNVTQFVGESELIGSAVDNLGGSLLSLSQNIEATAYALGAAGAVIATAYGVKTTAAIGASITATYARIKADGEALVAQRTLEAQTARTTLVRLESAAAESNIALKVEAASAARLRSSIAAFDAEFALEAQRQRAQISETGRIQSGLRMSEINASRAITANQLTASETALSAALARTTAAETAATASKARLGAATAAVTTATVAQTTASRALGVATSFLMGPWGILIAAVGLGAATFLTASENIDEATASAEKHAKAMSELEAIYSKWNKSRLEDERNKLLARSNEILFERLDIESKIQKLSKNATIQQGMETIVNPEVLNEINDLQEKLASLNEENANVDNGIGKVIKALDNLIVKKVESNDVVNNSVDANKKLANSFNAQVLALQNQQMQLSMTADEFEIYGAVQSAIAYGATPEMTAAIVEQVKALQSQRNAIAATSLELEGMMSGDLFGFGKSGGGTDEFSDNLKSITDDIDNFGGAWSRTGNVVVDAFGDMSDAMNDYASRMKNIGDIQAKIDKQVLAVGDDKEKLAKIDIEQVKLNEERVSAELSGYRSLAEGSASLFSEKTAAAKAFTAISQVLAVTEIALSYQKMAASTVETGVVVANETTKQSANALTAITAAFAAPFPVGFVAGAAMIGIMASLLGGAFGGGGGGSYTAPEIGGTGTVLGDDEAQSASITNAFDKLEDIELDQLSELRGIRSSMQALNNGIANLAKSFVTGLDFSDGGYAGQLGTSTKGIADVIGISMPSLIEKMPSFIDPILSFFVGGFSSKKKELLDSGITFVSQTFADIFNSGQLDASVFQVIETTKKKFWGLSKKTSTNTEFSDIDNAILEQMGSIFGFIGESVIGAVESLGLEASHIIHTGIGALGLEDALAGFQIDIGDVSFKDKTGDEIQKELEAIFSQQADLIAKYLVPSIAEYQQMGEGAFETLQRVAYEQAVFNDSLERTGMSLSNLSALMQIDVTQSIIGMIGGIEKFSELSNSFFKSFYSESDQLEYMERSITNVFDSLNLSIVGTREEFKSLVNGLDLTKEADQALYAALLELSPVMDEYLGALDDLANEKLSLQIELLNAQGKSLEALALKRQMELDATDESLHAILKQIWALDDAARAEKERTAELEAAQRLQDQYTGLRIRLLNEMGMSEDALAMSREIELSKLDESLHAMMRQIWAQQDLNAERDKEIAALNEMKLTLENNVKFAEQQLEKARQAEIGRINATVTKAQEAYDFEIQSINKQREAYNAFITELESKVSAAETALNASLSAELSKYDKLIEAVNSKASAEIEALNDVSSARLSALNDERGIVASIASELGKASKSFTAAQALNAARRGDFNHAGNIALGDGYTDEISARVGQGREAFALNEIGKLADAQLSDLDRTIAATESATERQIAAINDATQKEVEQLEAQKLAIEEQVKAALGIDDSVLALDVALAQYQAAQDELQKALAENTLEKLQAQEDVALLAFEQAKSDAQKQIDALNEQVDGLLNIDNSVMSVQAAIELLLAERKELDDLSYDAQIEQIELLHALNTTVGLILAKPNATPDFGPIKDLFDPIVKKQPIDTTWPIMNPIVELAKEVKQSNDASNEARQVADSANRAIAKNTASTAKILQRLEINNESRSVL